METLVALDSSISAAYRWASLRFRKKMKPATATIATNTSTITMMAARGNSCPEHFSFLMNVETAPLHGAILIFDTARCPLLHAPVIVV
jgi:hypothetical protein